MVMVTLSTDAAFEAQVRKTVYRVHACVGLVSLVAMGNDREDFVPVANVSMI